MVRLYVNVQFQVKQLSTGTSSSRTKKKIPQKILELIPPRCVPSFKSLAQVFADICKCPISSQTIKYRYKFKSNQQKFPQKFLNWSPQGVYQVSSLYHKYLQIYVNVQFQVKPLSTGTSSSRTKKFYWQKMLVWTPSRCVPSFKSLEPV